MPWVPWMVAQHWRLGYLSCFGLCCTETPVPQGLGCVGMAQGAWESLMCDMLTTRFVLGVDRKTQALGLPLGHLQTADGAGQTELGALGRQQGYSWKMSPC